MLASKIAMAAAGIGGDELAEAIDFDGTNDYLSRASDLTGNADGKTFTFSCWFYLAETPNATSGLIWNTSGGFGVSLTGTGTTLDIRGVSPASSFVLDASLASGNYSKQTWHHLLISVDLDNTSNRYVYIDDQNVTASVTWSTYVATNIDFTGTEWFVASTNAGATQRLEGRQCFTFLDYTYRDLSIESNRRLFIDADGFPASGQADLSPILYLPMTDPDTVEVNEGTGGDFTLNGTIARSGRGPNQVNAVSSTFAGGGDIIYKNAGFADGKVLTISATVKKGTSAAYYIGGDGGYFYFGASGNNFVLQAWDSALSAVTVEANISGVFSALKYRNIVISFDLTDTGKRLIYIDGVAQTPTWTTYLNNNMTLNRIMGIGGRYSGGAGVSYWVGEISEVWMDDVYTDLSTTNPFWDADTSKPLTVEQVIENTGVTPVVALPMRGDDAGNNLGTGGDFTVNSGPFTGARGPSEFWAGAAEFNGSNQYLNRTSALTGIADSKVFTLAFAFYWDTTAATDRLLHLYDTVNARFNFILTTSGSSDLQMLANNSAGTRILTTGSGTALSSGQWYTVLISIDLADTGKRHFYLNGASYSTTYSDYTDAAISFSDGDRIGIGAEGAGASYFDGKIGFLWFNTEYIDFSDEANRLKFFDAFGYPVDLGEDGSTPTGNQPLIYLNDEFEAGTNYGSGGDFTPVNTPTDGGSVRG